MKTVDHYIELQKQEIIEEIKNIDTSVGLRNHPKVIKGVSITSINQLNSKATKIAIKMEARKRAVKVYNAAKKDTLRFLMPKKGSILNDIKLEEGIIIPALAAEVLDYDEITPHMIGAGLYESLSVEFDEYYYKLLKSFNMDGVPQEMKDKIEGWGKKDKTWKN